MSSLTEDNNKLKDELAAYVLGGLDDADRAQIETYLRGCAECQQLIGEYQSLAGLLPNALPVAAPPPEAKAHVMSRIRASKTAALPPKQSMWDRLRPLFTPLRWGVAFAMIAGLVFWNVQLQREIGRTHSSAQANGRVFVLLGTGVPGASGRLVVAPGFQRAELDISGLPQLAANRIYQFWFARPGHQPESGGTFTVDSQGHAVASINVPVPLNDVNAIAVTDEPAPGSLRPTTKHLVDGKP
jgi:anti-sigma-K factor RskA